MVNYKTMTNTDTHICIHYRLKKPTLMWFTPMYYIKGSIYTHTYTQPYIHTPTPTYTYIFTSITRDL